MATERPAHGRQFVKIMIDLIGRWIGVPERELFKKVLKKHRVKFSKPRSDMKR
jgi:hypothetical protein